MQALQMLRVYTNVPQLYSQTVKRGMKIALTFPEYPGKDIQGTLVRTADAIDPVSRTLLVEVDVDNRAGELMPGSLAQVHFKMPPMAHTFIVPAAALIFRREGLRWAPWSRRQGQPSRTWSPSSSAKTMAQRCRSSAASTPTIRVIQDPPDSLIDGEKVTVVQPRQQLRPRRQYAAPAAGKITCNRPHRRRQ